MVSEFLLASWNLASLVDESRHVSTYELDDQKCREMKGTVAYTSLG
jgi:hypothetical protein